MGSNYRPHLDPLSIVAVAFILFIGTRVFSDNEDAQLLRARAAAVEATLEPVQPAVIAPYTSYTLTQGPHGASYGHWAIDLMAGKGAQILSPITGMVTESYLDELDNSTLIIENEAYRITLLHGIYTVDQGQDLQQGQPIGWESNIGYTLDWAGNLCTGRDCGYHTHLNIFDKSLGVNVNPLDLISETIKP
jgi:murein DD-endopeptidase MepM/ murein hydrolase activator NlpD